LDDGDAVYCEKIIKEYDIAKCYNYNSNGFSSYKTDRIVKIVNGKDDIFLEMPKNAQLKWDSATIYFRNKRYLDRTNLLVKKVWTEGGVLYCETETENLKFDIEYIQNVKKGYARKPEFHEMNKAEQEIVKQNYYKNELEKEYRRRSLEEDINKMIRSE
jgi:hypothetical protein